MDQIAGFIVRDPKLIDQGKREWRKAAAIRREKKRRAARGETVLRNTGNGKTTKGSAGAAHAHSSKKSASSAAAKVKATGFLASLFGKKKKLSRATSSGTVRRALTKPGQYRAFLFVVESSDMVLTVSLNRFKLYSRSSSSCRWSASHRRSPSIDSSYHPSHSSMTPTTRPTRR